MPSKSPTLYSTHKTTIWFSIASIALLAGLVAMVLKDSNREWKMWQREFVEYNREKTEQDLKQAEKALNQKQIQAIEEKINVAEEAIEEQSDLIAEHEARIEEIKLDINIANSEYQVLKQHQDSDRYYFEEYREHEEAQKADYYQKKMTQRAVQIQNIKLKIETLEEETEAVGAKITAITGERDTLELEGKRLKGDISRIENKLKKLEPNWMQEILNAPMLDFMKPSLQIQQIVVEDLKDDYFFTHVQKVDRCVSCHLAIDQKGFEDADGPFKTHPNLDLFVAANSAHPMEAFGCTTCHGGNGHSLSFTTASHTPGSPEQQAEWKREYHWKEMKHWTDKMLPLESTEAACAKCHTGVVNVPEAPKLNESRALARTFGCVGCHKVKGFENTWKAGPGLKHVQSKLENEWIVRWLHNPREFRQSTKMPRIFHLSNTSDAESKEKSNASIAGVASYLMKFSNPVALETPAATGNPESGKQLVEDLGCLGCHTAGGHAANNFGPELSGLGSKVKADWLYTWLKNPKHYMPDTRMPDLRLSDEEAADITSYLLADKNEKFDSLKLPLIKEEVVDELAIKFMTGTLRYSEAKEKLDAMSLDKKLEFVGEKTIAHQGCYGCHDIKGFEDTTPIGTELTQEGSKDIHRFDFGFIHLPHTRQDWLFQKLKEPRIFDRGKEKSYHEKLRMPQFDFTDEQASLLTTFLLSLVKAEIPLEMQKVLTEKEAQIEEGRFVTTKFNCQGCHTLDGKEGAVGQLFEDLGNAPPNINGEGQKAQPDWLYAFLDDPTPIRPWLKYRMPTFGFDDDQMTSLIQYFNHLDGVPPHFAREPMPAPDPESVAIGRDLFIQFQCIKCHKSNPEPGLTASFLAPDLVMSKERLRPEWIVDWLKDPQALMEGTMMPGFFADGETPLTEILEGDAHKQMMAMRDYIWTMTTADAKQLAQSSAAQNNPPDEQGEDKNETNL